jgi:hypothetical protein
MGLEIVAEKTPDEVREAIGKIALEESVRGLAIQDATLTAIRQGAAAIGTLNGLVATFLGREALSQTAREACSSCGCRGAISLAMLSLFASLILVAYLFKPRAAWKLHSSAKSIIDQFSKREPPVPLSTTYEVLAKFKEDDYVHNDKTLSRMFPCLVALILLLAFQVALWSLALFY